MQLTNSKHSRRFSCRTHTISYILNQSGFSVSIRKNTHLNMNKVMEANTPDQFGDMPTVNSMFKLADDIIRKKSLQSLNMKSYCPTSNQDLSKYQVTKNATHGELVHSKEYIMSMYGRVFEDIEDEHDHTVDVHDFGFDFGQELQDLQKDQQHQQEQEKKDPSYYDTSNCKHMVMMFPCHYFGCGKVFYTKYHYDRHEVCFFFRCLFFFQLNSCKTNIYIYI